MLSNWLIGYSNEGHNIKDLMTEYHNPDDLVPLKFVCLFVTPSWSGTSALKFFIDNKYIIY